MPIYIYKNNQQSGPFEEAKVLEMLAAGQLSPNDMGIRNGESQWQPLKALFPNTSPIAYISPTPINNQPTAQKSGGSKVLFVLLGLGSLFLLGIVALGAFVFISRRSAPPLTVAPNNSEINAAKTPPVVDEKKAKELSDKKEELAKLSPPLKLDPKAMFKGKVLFVGNFGVGETSAVSEGISSRRIAETLDKLETLIQVNCSKGKFLGNYEKGVKAYASDCKVSLIDYRTPAVVAQKTFSNAKVDSYIPEKDVRGFEYLTPRPIGAVQLYLNSFALEKEMPNDSILIDEKELLKISVPVNLNPNAVIKGKIKILQRHSEGTVEITNARPITFGGTEQYGLPPAKFTYNPKELETLIRIICSKGDRIGKVENTTEYSNRCEVSLIDYKNLSVFAQKTIENKTLNPNVRKESYPIDWVVDVPKKEIEDYLKIFPAT